MKKHLRTNTFVGAVLLCYLAVPSRGYGQQWHLEAHAGQLQYQANPGAIESPGLVLGLRYDDPASWLRISGGVPLGADAPVWGAADAWKRLAVELGPFAAGVDLAGQGFLQRHQTRERSVSGPLDRLTGSETLWSTENVWGFGLAGQVMPMLALEGPHVRLQTRSGLSHYYRTMGEEDLTRTVRISDLRLTLGPSRNLSLSAELSHFGAEEGGYARGGVVGRFSHRHGSAWASVGRWFAEDVEGVPWSVGGRVNLSERVALSVSARRTVLDPIYRSVPRTSWGAGLSIRLGDAPVSSEPVPASYVRGRATILLPVSAASVRPRIAGDFNSWQPEPMTRAGDNWSYTVALAPGVYNYSFVRPDGSWFVPESVPGRKPDGMGGYVAVLVVR